MSEGYIYRWRENHHERVLIDGFDADDIRRSLGLMYIFQSSDLSNGHSCYIALAWELCRIDLVSTLI